jgi:hypothetical protein
MREQYALSERCQHVLDIFADFLTSTLCDGGGGNVFKLMPRPDGGWTYRSLYEFHGLGGSVGGVVLDANANVFGTSAFGGSYGAIWEITP